MQASSSISHRVLNAEADSSEHLRPHYARRDAIGLPPFCERRALSGCDVVECLADAGQLGFSCDDPERRPVRPGNETAPQRLCLSRSTVDRVPRRRSVEDSRA